jgi:hypothetical protein
MNLSAVTSPSTLVQNPGPNTALKVVASQLSRNSNTRVRGAALAAVGMATAANSPVTAATASECEIRPRMVTSLRWPTGAERPPALEEESRTVLDRPLKT